MKGFMMPHRDQRAKKRVIYRKKKKNREKTMGGGCRGGHRRPSEVTEKVQETAERGGRSQGPDLQRKQQKSGWGMQEEGSKGQAEPETRAVTELWQPRWAERERGILGKGRHPMEQSGKEGRERLERAPNSQQGGGRDTRPRAGRRHRTVPPPLMKEAPWGRGRSPTPLTQWEGGRQRAQAGQAFIMGEGHVTNWEGGRRNPEVQP